MRFNTIIFLLLHLFTHHQAYTPVNNFTISCGTTGTSYDGERTWTGDADLGLLLNQDNNVSAEAATQSPSTNHVPYATARLSRSQFGYSFSVTAGPILVRLFFYPAFYPSFPRTDASFTVQCNQFFLLRAFNASLNADAENKETIFKEYIVYVDDGEEFILTFTPAQPNSYAFINGIEVLSMPTDLYYTPANETGFTFVGSSTLYRVETRFSLQTVYRIKTGGQEITPQNDTGLFRYWADEEAYFIKQNPKNDDLAGDIDGKMNITVNPDYIAPKELFRTARSMGTNATLNKMSNLTWEFPVDYGFTYVLRLHFCELDPNIHDIGDRQFIIYIANRLAEDRADVMKWSQKQKGLAVQRNYAIFIPKNDTNKKFNFSLQMHPYGSNRDTRYIDAFLNGLEIFKIRDGWSNSLAGPNPDPVQNSFVNMPDIQKGKEKIRTLIIVIVTVVVVGVFFISLVLCVKTSKWTLWFPTTKITRTQNCSLSSHVCRRFSITEIKAATKNFDNVLIIGVGGFGHVYKGYIDGGSIPAAIKRLRQGSQQGACEFMNEIEMLSQLRHRHLVSLIGYCCDHGSWKPPRPSLRH